jgi:peptide/nickel transport system permease protein
VFFNVASRSLGRVRGPLSLWRSARSRHPLAAFLGVRAAQGVLVLFVASVAVFAATNALPGNVATAVLGKDANPQNVHQLETQLGLDRPFIDRYDSWVGGILHGDFGRSAVAVAQDDATTSVSALIGTPFRNSLVLAGFALLIIVPLSLLLGAVAGANGGRAPDYAISYTALVLGAFPEFVLGTALIAIFFTWLGLLPPVSLIEPRQTPFTHPSALVLPVLTLVGVALSFSARQVRAGMVEVLRQDYVVMARLNGYSGRRVLTRYALRNALAPSVQAFAQTAQYLVGGIVIIEALFAYPGIGSLMVNAVKVRDLPEVAAIAVILAAFYIGVNIVADLIVVFLVPKLRTAV